MKKLLFTALVMLAVQAFAQKVEKNGTIYKEHPYIEVVKNSITLFKNADMDALAKLYADTAKFYDSPNPKVRSLAEAKKEWAEIWAAWDIKEIKVMGYPDALEYDTDPFTVQSWWAITAINKKTNKTAKFRLVQFDLFNKDGKIVRESAYYDTSALMAASK